MFPAMLSATLQKLFATQWRSSAKFPFLDDHDVRWCPIETPTRSAHTPGPSLAFHTKPERSAPLVVEPEDGQFFQDDTV